MLHKPRFSFFPLAFLLLLTRSNSLWASDEHYFIWTSDHKKVELRVIPREDCLATIRIVEAMEFLTKFSVENEGTDCFVGIFSSWNNHFSSLSPQASYETHRLFALYSARAKKSPLSAEVFCAENEVEQRRDRKLFQSIAELSQRYNMGSQIMVQGFAGADSWKYAEDLGLTEGEYVAVRAYLLQFYQVINPALRKRDLPEDLRVYNEALSSGLRRFPAYRGEVRRGSNLPPEVLAQHEPGKLVTYDAHTSASLIPGWTWGNSPHVFIIQSKGAGRNTLDMNPGAKEVIFPAGTKFRIVSRKPLSEGKFEFQLEEVD